MDLKNVFEANGIYDVFRKKRGICGVDYEKIGCDYFIWSENTVASALGERKKDNKKNKHSRHAKNGWYRYDTRFALPVYDENGDVERYNVFSARLLIRHASSGKMYLYDVLEIKKETSKSCQE